MSSTTSATMALSLLNNSPGLASWQLACSQGQVWSLVHLVIMKIRAHIQSVQVFSTRAGKVADSLVLPPQPAAPEVLRVVTCCSVLGTLSTLRSSAFPLSLLGSALSTVLRCLSCCCWGLLI